MRELDRHDLRRADSLASWSFIGLVVPLIGWILAGLSKSTLRRIEGDDERTQREVTRINKKASISILISVFVVIAYVAFYAWVYKENERLIELQQNEARVQEILRQQEDARKQNALNECLNSAYNDYKTSWEQESAYLGYSGKLPSWNADRQEAAYAEAKNLCYINNQ